MKKSILFLASILFFATGCYEDYVKDYDTSGVFVAYQYNMRTFVLDEGEQFDLYCLDYDENDLKQLYAIGVL